MYIRRHIEKTIQKIAERKGAVICMVEKPLPLTETVWAINVDQI